MPLHPLTNFEIQKYYEIEPEFHGFYSRDTLSVKLKDWEYIINPDQHSDIGTHYVAMYVSNNNFTYFNSFGVENILKHIQTFNSNKNIKTDIFMI